MLSRLDLMSSVCPNICMVLLYIIDESCFGVSKNTLSPNLPTHLFHFIFCCCEYHSVGFFVVMIQNMPHPSPSQCPRPPIFMPATFYDGSRELQGRQLSRGSRGSSSTKNIGTRHQSAFPNVSLFFFSSLSSFPFSSFLLFPSPFFLSFSSFFLFPFSPFLLFSCSSSLLFSFSSVTLFLFSFFSFFAFF